MARRSLDRGANADAPIETISSTLAQLEKDTAEPYTTMKHLTTTAD
jgi:hypothetical protein